MKRRREKNTKTRVTSAFRVLQTEFDNFLGLWKYWNLKKIRYVRPAFVVDDSLDRNMNIVLESLIFIFWNFSPIPCMKSPPPITRALFGKIT